MRWCVERGGSDGGGGGDAVVCVHDGFFLVGCHGPAAAKKCLKSTYGHLG